MTSTFCQSCSMPIDDPKLQGTEKNGAKNTSYCIYCYQQGAFVNPDTTLEEMKALVREKMLERQMDATLITMAVNSLPYLQRWRAVE